MVAPNLDRICHVLLTEWDPIGVRDIGQARDEYNAYAPQIASLLAANATVSAISEHLLLIETERMGLPPDRIRAERVAAMLHMHHHGR